MLFKNTVLSSFLAGTALGWGAPGYSGFNLVWQDSFAGSGGSSPNGNNWNTITGYLNVNAELEVYTSSNRNLQLSGGDTLQIVPWRDSSAQNGWTSARIESKYVFTPQAGRLTRVEAPIRFGTSAIANKQGIWPAFWMLGDSLRHGGVWPASGEIDILETVNGQLTGYGTIHCDVYPGGICNEGTGIGGTISIPDQDWHTWRVEIDRRPASWVQESITWYRDGIQFHQVTGGRINNQAVWNTLARSPLYFILNVAVGGTWPGYPNGNTQDGYGSMMEVGYVAQYVSTTALTRFRNSTIAANTQPRFSFKKLP
ncbi:hypothetical protein NW762_011472 [Fusarium torreyae]|uniref:GH16 domain-containing protein n=1 Tax=Fusarium torreyae TaxID=1237075 RepID=A0A9W8RR24_9HYPO|nr:hypothetical protein NW762_011472 [Fusarium torreyae]